MASCDFPTIDIDFLADAAVTRLTMSCHHMRPRSVPSKCFALRPSPSFAGCSFANAHSSESAAVSSGWRQSTLDNHNEINLATTTVPPLSGRYPAEVADEPQPQPHDNRRGCRPAVQARGISIFKKIVRIGSKFYFYKIGPIAPLLARTFSNESCGHTDYERMEQVCRVDCVYRVVMVSTDVAKLSQFVKK